ncbi:ATP-dependent nuclease [Nocardioides sp. BYT-33-1]|uniref:ATP-dependent nuclease n=1 Tax=Nocardioides sp. BYT-33-1 TaxID=3416952 RepID=UPI003F529D22
MRLTRVMVKNHSRLDETDIEIRGHLILVGPNDVGKSSLLRCLDLLLGASTAQIYSRTTIDDFRDETQPFVIEATITDLGADDQAAFPDEATVDPVTNELTLTLSFEATIEDSDGTIAISRTAPNSGSHRQLSRLQIDQLGWNLLGATGISRELREDRRNAVQDILQQVDLGAEQTNFETLITQIQDALTTSPVLDGIRGNLSAQLSKALPVSVDKDELKFETDAMADGDVLAGVRLRLERDGKAKDLTEQSDGLRALYAIALYDLVSTSANMVAVDEPEIHLHPTSQRSLARLLRDGKNQKLLATHSPDIVSAFPADSIVSVRPGGVVVQPDAGFLSDDEKMVVHWWVRDKLEPLTANGVIGAEGISDRILIERIADLTERNLDRLGISLVETRGSGNMPAIIKLFGLSGFQVPLSILIDEDARAETAGVLGVAPANVEQHGVYVSQPDLEGEYIAAIGHEETWDILEKSGLFTAHKLKSCPATGPAGTRTAEDVRGFCLKNKVHAAMAVERVLDRATAQKITSVCAVLDEIAKP